MKKLCIFDLDGTLLDTIDDIANSSNRVLKAGGFPEYSVAWYKRMVGRGTRRLMADAVEQSGRQISGEQFELMLRRREEDYQAHCAELTKPYGGIPELLDRLAEMGVKTAIISNKPEITVHECVRQYFPGHSFAAALGDAGGRPLKPDPHLAREVLSRAGVSAGEAVFVGDSEVDMAFAERAGIFGVGVLWGFRERGILLEHGAKALVETPGQILGYIK